MQTIDEALEKSLKIIDNNDFKIAPKIINNKNISCEFCSFKDICYKAQKDTVYLDKVEDLSFLEEEGY